MKTLRRTPSALPAFAILLAAQVACARSSPAPAPQEMAGLVRQAEERGTSVVQGKDAWLFFVPELRHLAAGRFWGDAAAGVSQSPKKEYADPLPAILDFKRQLERSGIALLLVPVPAKAAIYPEMLPGAEARAGAEDRVDRADAEFRDLLRAEGIEVLDLAPEFLARKETAQLYCRQDTHWSGEACVIAARLLAARVREAGWHREYARNEYTSSATEQEIEGDLRRLAGEPRAGRERVALRVIGTRASGGREAVAPDPSSPIVLLGDSHNLVFHAGGDMHAVAAGLPDQLALELGFPVDLVAVRGSGATPARINLLRRARAPGYLENKRLVIWCFSAREFTQAQGWMPVPVVK